MALDKKLLKKVQAANKAWGKARKRAETEKTGGFDEIADGRYIARLVGAEIGESKSSGRLQVAWEYKIMEGDYKGQTKRDFDGLESEDNLMYLARKIAKYGYEAPEDLEEVDALLTQIVKEKPLVRIRLKTKGGSDFQNVYIDQVFDAADEADVLADAAAESSGEEDAEEESVEEDATEEESGDEEATDEESSDEEEATEEEVEEEDDEAELTVGMQVVATVKGDNVLGEVLEILADEGKVRLKTESGKVIRVPIDALSMPPKEEEEDAEEDVPEAPPAKKTVAKAAAAPAKASAKKPAPAPVKKKK